MLQGNEARFLNHSCEPSCVAYVAPSQSGLRVIICTRRQVRPGQELTLDYREAGIQVRHAAASKGTLHNLAAGPQASS